MAELTPLQVIELLAPLVLIQVGLMITALIDLERQDRRVRGASKLVWVLIIVLVNILGPLAYFMVGREDA